MEKNNLTLFLQCSVLLMALICQPALGLVSDSDQPITIDADTATYDEAAGLSVYTGNVVSVQGSIRVYSEKLVVHIKNEEPEKLVFTGNPARFKQSPEGGGDDIVGEAATGEYHPDKSLLVLRGNAVVRQGSNTYSSDYIEYDIQNALVRAGDKSSNSKRVRVILKPKAK